MINQITQVVLPDGQTVSIVGWSSRPVYSTADLLSGFTDDELRLFSYAEGGSDQVTHSNNLAAAARRAATKRDTNIHTASEMDSMQEFLVYEIKAEVFQFSLVDNSFSIGVLGLPMPTAPALAILQHRIVVSLEVSQKDYPSAGLGWYPAGGGVSGFATDQGNTLRTYATNGLPTHEASYTYPLPVHMGGTEEYGVLLENPGSQPVNFTDDQGNVGASIILQPRIYLCGLQKRPTG